MYSLYGVVEHSGTLYSGHYVAKIRKLVEDGSELSNDRSVASSHSKVEEFPLPEQSYWCHTSDSHTRETEAHSSQAYLLF